MAQARARSGSGGNSGSAACRARRCCRHARTRRTSPPIRVSICSPAVMLQIKGPHCESWRSKPACGAVVGTRCLTYPGSSGRLQPAERTLRSCSGCLGALLPAALHNWHIRASAVSWPANARVAAVAAGHDPPPGNPGYQPPRILNSYDRWTLQDGMRWRSLWASVDGALVERMGLSMVRQLGLQSGVAMEVTGRCAETFRLRSDGRGGGSEASTQRQHGPMATSLATQALVPGTTGRS